MVLLTYRDAGVDIEAGDEAVRRIARPPMSARRPEVRVAFLADRHHTVVPTAISGGPEWPHAFTSQVPTAPSDLPSAGARLSGPLGSAYGSGSQSGPPLSPTEIPWAE